MYLQLHPWSRHHHKCSLTISSSLCNQLQDTGIHRRLADDPAKHSLALRRDEVKGVIAISQQLYVRETRVASTLEEGL